MNTKRAVAASFVSMVLAGCGGGGGNDDPVPLAAAPAPTPAPAPAPAAAPTPAVVPVVLPSTPVPIPVAGTAIATTPVADTKPVDSNPAPTAAPTPPGIPAGATLPLTNNTQGFYFLTSDEKLYRWSTIGTKWELAVQQPAPAPSPPPAAPVAQPAEGTYVLGSVVKKAMQSNPNTLANCNQSYRYYSYNASCDTTAYETPKGGVPDITKPGIQVGFWSGATYFSHYSYPVAYDYGNPNPRYPSGNTGFQVVYPNGIFALGKTLTTYGNSAEKALVRSEGDFEIKDDLKFILNRSAATWNGVEGENFWFVQLQISSFGASDTVFKLCLHEYFTGVRRLACTLHNKDTGQYKGTQVLDDSRGLGAVEYLTPND